MQNKVSPTQEKPIFTSIYKGKHQSASLEANFSSLTAVSTHIAALGSVVGHTSAHVGRMLRFNAVEINIIAKILQTMIVSWRGRFHIRTTLQAIVATVSC